MTYNGWTNYETWLTNLHYDGFCFEDQVNDGVFDDMDDDEIRVYVRDYIEESIKDMVEEYTPDNLFIQDLINSALCEVDWHDIADQYMEDIMSDMRLRNESLYGGAD